MNSEQVSYKVTAVVGSQGSGKTGGEQYDARLLQVAKLAGVQVEYITWENSSFNRVMAGPVLWRFRDFTRTCWLTWKVWRSSGDVLIDVWMAPYLTFWAKLTKRNIILMVHHLRAHLESSSLRESWVLSGERTLINRASNILTVSQSSKRQIEVLLNFDKPIDVIPPGFERPSLVQQEKSEPSEVVRFLCVGHVTQAKGILDLIGAAAMLAKEKMWHIDIVGSLSAEPATAEQARKLIRKNDLQDKVILRDRVTGQQLQHFYQAADVFVLPSYWEGYGIVFLEAMVMGLPVIATTAGAIPEVVPHEKAGLLVEKGDVAALFGAMNTLMLSPTKREQYAEQAKIVAAQAPDWVDVEKQFQTWWQGKIENVC